MFYSLKIVGTGTAQLLFFFQHKVFVLYLLLLSTLLENCRVIFGKLVQKTEPREIFEFFY